MGAFPFEHDLAPVVLTYEALVRVVALMTGRHEKVLRKSNRTAKKGGIDWVKVIWRSFAVWERDLAGLTEKSTEEAIPGSRDASPRKETIIDEDVLFAIGDDEDDEDDEGLTLSALDALDAIEAFELPEKTKEKDKEKEQPKHMQIQSARIPIEIMRRIIMLLLLVAPIEPTQPVAVSVERFTGEELVQLQATAENVLRGFTCMGDEGGDGIGWRQFKTIFKQSMVSSSAPQDFWRYIYPNTVFSHTFLTVSHLCLNISCSARMSI